MKGYIRTGTNTQGERLQRTIDRLSAKMIENDIDELEESWKKLCIMAEAKPYNLNSQGYNYKADLKWDGIEYDHNRGKIKIVDPQAWLDYRNIDDVEKPLQDEYVESEKFSCKECGREYKHQKDLEHHYEETHLQEEE